MTSIMILAGGGMVTGNLLGGYLSDRMIAAAFMQATFNIANALGAFLGGIPLHFGLPYIYPSLVGVGMTLIGLIICLTYIKKHSPELKPAS